MPVHPDGTLGGCLKLKTFTSQKNTLCSTTRAPTTVDNRANPARTARCGEHKRIGKCQYRRHTFKQPRCSKCRVQCSSCCDLNASRIPELIKQLSTPQQKLPGETWLATARQSLKQHTRVINRPSGFFLEPYGTLSGCLKLKSGPLGCSPIHSKTERQTTNDTTSAHKPAHERLAFDDRRRLGTTRRATASLSRRHAFQNLAWRLTVHTETQKLGIKSKRRVTGCLIVRQRTCSPRWHTRLVPQTEVSQRLVLIRSPVKKTRCVQQHVRPRLWTTVPTLYEHGLLWISHKKS